MSYIGNYDFQFYKDKTNIIVPMLIGFLMYAAVIVVFGFIFSYNLDNEWSSALRGKLTIEVQVKSDEITEMITDKQKNDVISIVEKTPGVISVKLLKAEEILKIIEPWLSATAIPDDFPFPIMFDVLVKKDEQLNLLALSDKLSKISSNIKVHDHSNWYSPVLRMSGGLLLFTLCMACFVLFIISSTIVYITKQSLNVHTEVVKILQLIGASDKYIANQFRKYYLYVCTKAAYIAIIMGNITVFVSNYLCNDMIFCTGLIQYICVLFLIIFVIIFLIVVTSNRTVLYFLKKDKCI